MHSGVRPLIAAAIVALFGASFNTASAEQLAQTSSPTLKTPSTHGDCSNAQETDTITISGLGPNQSINGRVDVQFVTDTGRTPVPNSVIYQGTTFNSPFVLPLTPGPADITITVQYPPEPTWPSHADGTREIHVDVSFAVFQGGVIVDRLGSGHDWDVSCLGPPATSTSTPTTGSTPTTPPTPVGTATPTETPTVPGSSPGSTPTSTGAQTDTPTATSTPTPSSPGSSSNLTATPQPTSGSPSSSSGSSSSSHSSSNATATWTPTPPPNATLPTDTAVPVPTSTPTEVPTVVAGVVATPSSSEAPTLTPTATSLPTETPVPTEVAGVVTTPTPVPRPTVLPATGGPDPYATVGFFMALVALGVIMLRAAARR